ncbi:hypothetical protein L198_04049 [Cryptococcus wingfieldii CBS 7118]|uniref:Major facilitator superfamily (MFS) profile domain-containing protein n=1 Tax=Cryptococcus wingfieldii CBS 7118 TaxID=1295528 RepID=A0A1E3J9G4_9TREE|nr:hypothetical protein L198_04049 [Cryptococcus wingfieldii CBS 7118]ODN97482.1 hypothetical protein L198_04049 [Cryptococcus wingfieldii CBS 7118]
MAPTPKAIVLTAFLALVLDLLAFTIPLPLFPRLIEWYLAKDTSPTSLISRSLAFCSSIRSTIHSLQPASVSAVTSIHKGSKNWDVVLLGGMMGSLFSFCQCIISPWLGRLSDRYGRRKVLLATMVGNIASAAIWIQSTSFESYILSRLVAGLSEGNVQLTTAIIGDVTDAASRSKSLALVGIAFSICFTFGPSLGAYFATRPLPLATSEDKYNVYAMPAAISLALLVLETLYLAAKLPETKGYKLEQAKAEQKEGEAAAFIPEPKDVVEKMGSLDKLKDCTNLHGLFLLFFSGAEFTLTFLTYDIFSASNAYNGKLLGFIGILAAMIQGRYVRPHMAKVGELQVALSGILSCTIGLLLISAIPFFTSSSFTALPHILLYAGATCLAFTSATVVTGLTAAAAGCCDERFPQLQRGRAMGKFRSRGQLGRSVGPLLASGLYWINGPSVAYLTLGSMLAAVLMFAPRGGVEGYRPWKGKSKMQ